MKMKPFTLTDVPERYVDERNGTQMLVNISQWMCDIVCFMKENNMTKAEAMEAFATIWNHTIVTRQDKPDAKQ